MIFNSYLNVYRRLTRFFIHPKNHFSFTLRSLASSPTLEAKSVKKTRAFLCSSALAVDSLRVEWGKMNHGYMSWYFLCDTLGKEEGNVVKSFLGSMNKTNDAEKIKWLEVEWSAEPAPRAGCSLVMSIAD